MSFKSIFSVLSEIDAFFWSYVGFSLIVIFGLYFTFVSKGLQFRVLASLPSTLRGLHRSAQENTQGVAPLKLYFASIGGMIGLGNIVGITTALTIGGPGALVWVWVASFCGMLIKYAEIYLGIKYRVTNGQGGYDGGPMYFLQKAFPFKGVAMLAAFFLCIYGVETYQFLVITDTLTTTFSVPRLPIVLGLLALVLYSSLGGVKRLANICTLLMPGFIILYVLMCLWIIGSHFSHLPLLLTKICVSAFDGHAAVGGFAGSTFLIAAQHGIARSIYSGDIGLGFDSTLQSETRTLEPEKQARMAVFALLTDSIVCTMSIMVVLVTGLWCINPQLQPSQYVAQALGQHFPFIDIFIAVLFFLAGFTTIIVYFTVGLKNAQFLSKMWGSKIYIAYAVFAFIFFSYFDQADVILIMSLCSGALLLINLLGILKLRKEIHFG